MSTPDNLGLADSDFWSEPLPQPPRPSYGTEHGLVLAAPARVLLPVRKTIPAVVRRRGPLRDLASVPTTEHLLIHAMDVDRNELRSCRGAPPVDNAYVRPRDPAELAQMKGENTEYQLVDLAAQAGVALRPTELFVVATLREKSSNPRRIAVEPGPGVYTDPAVAEFLEKKRGELAPPEPSPDAVYTPVEGSPTPPQKPGIAISAERVTLLQKGATLTVRGAMRVPVRKQDLVPADAGRPEKAVVDVWLSLSGAEAVGPHVVRLRVPIFADPKDGLVEGYFSFDLLQRVKLPATAETYFLSVFCRDVFAAPQPLAFVTQASLPPGAK